MAAAGAVAWVWEVTLVHPTDPDPVQSRWLIGTEVEAVETFTVMARTILDQLPGNAARPDLEALVPGKTRYAVTLPLASGEQGQLSMVRRGNMSPHLL